MICAACSKQSWQYSTMSENSVITEDHGRVRTITINRPQALNSMNNDVFAGIKEALGTAEIDNSVAVVIVTGAGRAFSAGQDLTEMQQGLEGEPPATYEFQKAADSSC